jgi:hypothetical protein
MDETNTEAVEYKCPLCGSTVIRVKEMTEEECSTESDCSNCYYVHKGKKLIKITNPTTPTDVDRKKYE